MRDRNTKETKQEQIRKTKNKQIYYETRPFVCLSVSQSLRLLCLSGASILLGMNRCAS